MKPMKYNRAMDWVALALNELVANKNPVLAARLFAKAGQEGDVNDAIRTIEATNRYAHGQVVAAAKVKAELEPVAEEPCEEPVVAEFGEDPLDEVADEPVAEEEEMVPAVASTAKQMAAVLSRLNAPRVTASARPQAKVKTGK